jgi:hypothetical protein
MFPLYRLSIGRDVPGESGLSYQPRSLVPGGWSAVRTRRTVSVLFYARPFAPLSRPSRADYSLGRSVVGTRPEFAVTSVFTTSRVTQRCSGKTKYVLSSSSCLSWVKIVFDVTLIACHVFVSVHAREIPCSCVSHTQVCRSVFVVMFIGIIA